MALSNAEIQKRYRERCKSGGEPLIRLNTMISAPASAQLKRIAKQLGISQREALEMAIGGAEDRLIETLDNKQQIDFFNLIA